MSRVAWAFVVGLALLAAGLIITAFAPSSGGEVLLLLGCLVLAGLAFVVTGYGRRTAGWTRAWNPGAAYREAKGELEAHEGHEHELGGTEGDGQGS